MDEIIAERPPLFCRPDTVMRSYLTSTEKDLFDKGDATLSFVAPSRIAVVFRQSVLVLILAAAIVVSIVILILLPRPADLTLVGLVMMAGAIVVALLELIVLSRNYTRYIITPSRIIRMDGLVDRQMAQIGWDKITDISATLPLLGQMFGYGDISIETANEASSFGVLRDVPQPWLFRARLERAIDTFVAPAPTALNTGALEALVSLKSLLTSGSMQIGPAPGGAGWSVTWGQPSPPPESESEWDRPAPP